MKTIHVESILHKGSRRIKLVFPFDQDIIDRVRAIDDCRWSGTLRCWHLPYHRQSIADISKLRTEMKLDIPELDTLAEEESTKYFDRTLPKEKLMLIKSLIQYMDVQRYSERTVTLYSDAVKTFLGYFRDKRPEELTGDDVAEFNLKYVLNNGFSASYQNQVISSLKLLFRHILKKDMVVGEIERPFRGRSLPEIFSVEEVQLLLQKVKNVKHRAMLSLIYACGLRRSELIHLKINSIDSNRKLLIIKGSKGNKDRIVPLPESMIFMLRAYYKDYQPKVWLFEGHTEGMQFSETSLREVFEKALERAKIRKKLTLHSLRHSYATHLLENGVDLRFIQELLGHKSSKTTEIYTHVTSKSIEKIKSPFENIKLN
jgi:integrase/recombinase XerD